MEIKNVLSQNAFWQINKKIAKTVGINAALLLSDLVDKQSYLSSKDEIGEDGFFYSTAKQIEESTTLSYKQQKTAIEILESHNMIETQVKGVPAKRHFLIIEEEIWNCLNGKTRSALKEDLDVTKGETINNTSNNTDQEKENIKEKSLFVPKKQTPKEFYSYQLKISEGLKYKEQYKAFIDFLYGKNEIEERLDPILKIPKQVSYPQFIKLIEKAHEQKKKLSEIILKLYNNKKYTDGKRDLYLVLDNWISQKFLK